jgi:peptidoglycan LD-endopeptidase CwlK
MSTTLFPNDTLFSQRMLKAEGLYTGALDSIWGPLTEQAANIFEHKSRKLAKEHGSFDPRTENNINTLTLAAQQQARQFMTRVLKEIPGVKVISGTRSYDEQNRLFRQGRYHNPGNIITNVRGGSSCHNFGIAWDIGIFTDSKGYIPNGPLYDEAAKVGLTETLEWGGNWERFVDKPHYQLKLSKPIQAVRQHFEAGERYTMPLIAKGILA